MTLNVSPGTSGNKLGLGAGDTLLAVHADSQPGEVGSNITREEAGYFDYKVVGDCRNH